MIIPLDEGWRLKSDAYCWHVQKFYPASEDRKEDLWTSIKYYNSIEDAIKGLIRLRVMTADAEGLSAALNVVETIGKSLSDAITRHLTATDAEDADISAYQCARKGIDETRL